MDVNTRLYSAIGSNYLPAVRDRLAEGAEINKINKKGYSPLMFAAENCSNPEIFSLLIASGAKQDTTSALVPYPALIIAVRERNHVALNALIAEKLDLNIMGNRGLTALMHAVVQGDLEVVKLLIKAKANLKVMNESECTALMLALNMAPDIDFDIVDALLNAGAKIDIRSEFYTFLFQKPRSMVRSEIIFRLFASIPEEKLFKTRKHSARDLIKEYKKALCLIKNQMIEYIKIFNLCFDKVKQDDPKWHDTRDDNLAVQIASMLPAPRWCTPQLKHKLILDALAESSEKAVLVARPKAVVFEKAPTRKRSDIEVKRKKLVTLKKARC